MANTQPARLSFSVLDETGIEASIAEYLLVDPAMTVLQATTLWQAQATLLEAILDAGIQRGAIHLLTIPTGGAVAPAAGSRVEQTGVFTFGNTITSHRFGVALAGLAESAISAGKIVIVEDGPVDLWLDSILPQPGGLYSWTNTAQQLLALPIDAFLSFRKRRRLDRTSREPVPD